MTLESDIFFFSTESCRLLHRHWSISYSNGKNEVVDGEGVVGEQPTFTPGHHHQYSSCTMFDKEEYCEMEGYFLMKYLNRGELLHYVHAYIYGEGLIIGGNDG